MPTAIALRSFDHNGPVRKGDTVTFDAITIKALQRSGLVSKETGEDPKPTHTDGIAEIPTTGTFLLDKGEKVLKGGRKPGKKSVASPAAPASQPKTAQPSMPGALPPPPPVK